MGWKGHHLYAFVINGKRYSPPSEENDDPGKGDVIRTKLSSVFVKDSKVIIYEYDFRDNWEIEICNEPRDSSFLASQLAECIGGSGSGPVEDSGGAREYMEKARIYSNPQHRRYLEIRKLFGPKYSPDTFELLRANEMLKEMG